MLACIQRRQNLSSQRLACTPKSLDVPPPPSLLPPPPLQPCGHKGETASMISRYPSPAELDAFAQKTANSPLSIKIFPSDVRVPQHKQLNKTVNGLDTTGQRYSPYAHPYSGGYQGLLAIVKASAAVKGVVKNCEGRRTKHGNTQYNNPLNNGYTVRHGHRAYHISSCKPPDVPVETVCSGGAMAPQPELAQVQRLMRRLSRAPPGGAREAGASPSLQAVAAVAHPDSTDFVPGAPPPQSGLAFTGAVVPTQSADRAKAGYLEKAGEYAAWQHKQSYQQGALRMYEKPESRPQPLAYRQHPEVQADFSGGQYFWDGAVATPNSDCYTSQVLATGTCLARPRDLGLYHPHPQPQPHPLPQRQLAPPLPPHTQAYSADQNLCCGLPASSLCHAAALSSSLQSLECLISEIHPPCIKERMLGRGYEAMGMPQLLEHHQQAHIQLPVYR